MYFSVFRKGMSIKNVNVQKGGCGGSVPKYSSGKNPAPINFLQIYQQQKIGSLKIKLRVVDYQQIFGKDLYARAQSKYVCVRVKVWNFIKILASVEEICAKQCWTCTQEPCKCMYEVSTHADAHFCFVCGHLCTDPCQNFLGDPLLWYKLKFQVSLQNWAVWFFLPLLYGLYF